MIFSHFTDTIDVNYTDGRRETGITPQNFRIIDKIPESQWTPFDPNAISYVHYTVGAEVEAKYHGTGDWYVGHIAKDRGNGAFCVTFQFLQLI